MRGAGLMAEAEADRSVLLLKINTAVSLLSGNDGISRRYGVEDFDPYWLIDEAIDMLNEAALKISQFDLDSCILHSPCK